MDGFEGNSGVIVVAATNRSDILDNALLRPGRFDRRVTVGLPDVKGREQILNVHIRNKKLAEGITLNEIAKRDLAIRKEVQTIVQTTSHFCFTCLFFASFDGMLFLASPLKAIGTAGFSGADLENLMNESAILAARRNKTATRLGKIEIDRESGLPTSKSSTIFQRRCKVFLGCIYMNFCMTLEQFK